MSKLTATFQVGNYVIFKKRIGKGAFSTIYKGYHKRTKETVAIKEISLDILNKYESALRRETNIMKKLNHSNIVKLHETIIDDKTENVYLIMDFYKRGDFSKFLKKRPLKEKYALKYLKQIVDGLKYLMENQIIHRDLKPQNILMSDVGTLKIADFGFARYFEDDVMIQTVCGSPMWMAPEIIKNKQYNIKSDLWSIGVIFFQMLTGKTPFQANNILDLIKKIEKSSINIPNNIHLTQGCKELLLGLLEKDPDKRIEWNALFNHYLIKTCDPFEEENKLMEISGLEAFPSIPKKNNLFDSNGIHNSYYKYDNYKNYDNFNSKMITSNENSPFHNKNTEEDLSLEFNFNLKEDDEENEDSLNSSNELYYDSYEEPRSYQDRTEKIDSSFIKLDIEDDYFKSSFSLKNNMIMNDLPTSYVYIQNVKPRRNVSSSLRQYVSKSVNFIKESYRYFNDYNSL